MAASATRWGILGTSRIAHDFLVAMKTLPENEHAVVAVASRSLERAAEFAGKHDIGKAYGSYEEHVLCEKPMTMNLKDTKELFELAKAKGLFIMEVSERNFVNPSTSYPLVQLSRPFHKRPNILGYV